MLGDAKHCKGWGGGPDYEVALISEGKSEEVWKFAMHDGEEDGVPRTLVTEGIETVAEDQAQGVSGLMPRAVTLCHIRFGGAKVLEARDFKRISEIGSCETTTKELCKSTTSVTTMWVRKVVVQVGFPRCRKEEKPVFFHWRTGVGRIAGEFCEGRV